MRAIGTLIYCLWEHESVQSFWKTVWNSLLKLNLFIPSESAKHSKTYKTCAFCTYKVCGDAYNSFICDYQKP